MLTLKVNLIKLQVFKYSESFDQGPKDEEQELKSLLTQLRSHYQVKLTLI